MSRYASIRNNQHSGDIKQTVVSNQSHILSAIATTDNRLAEVQGSLAQLRSSDERQLPSGFKGHDLGEAVQQLDLEVAGLKSTSMLLESMLLKTKEITESIRTEPSVSFGSHNNISGIQIAINQGRIDVGGMNFGK